MKSEFNYIPNIRKAPCHKGHLCKNHRPTNGKCRDTCEDFKAYKDEKKKYEESNRSYYIHNDYKQAAVERNRRRYG